MKNLECEFNNSDGADCWIEQMLRGMAVDDISTKPDQINRCVKCERFQTAIIRSMGRRKSDRLVPVVINKLFTTLSNHNTELLTMAGNLRRTVEELTVLKTVSEALLKASNLKASLKIFLTGVTAGEAFGLNRAVVFLIDHQKHSLEGQLGFGHIAYESYNRTWAHIKKKKLTFSELTEKILTENDTPDNHLTELVKKTSLPLKKEFGLLPKAVLERRSFNVNCLEERHLPDKRMFEIFGGRPCAIIPIISKEHAFGVAIVDNPVTVCEITSDEVSMLETLSYLAASKIDNLVLQNQLEARVAELERLQRLLKDNQNYLLETERLVEAGILATTIAHEIKTPLVTIGGYSRRALKSYERGNNISHDLNVVIKEISRLEGITDGVLDYSKKRKLSLKVINLNSLISETIEILQSKLTYSEIEVEMRFSESSLTVKADKDRLKQVLFNIFDNAIQAMPNGGKLTVNTCIDNGYCRLTISDTGHGMTQETKDNLFKPFFTTKDGGSGLGLAVSRKIVADHGGYLEVSATSSEGSSFTVSLPATKKEENT